MGVLFVDTKNKNPKDIEDYYRVRGLVPASMEHLLENLNARLVITNYHTFEPKILQGNKRSPFDGKVDLQGKKIDTGNKEDFSQVVKRTLGKFKAGSRILILNDEAHHCYLPKSKSKTTDNEEADENARAAVWFSGLREIAKKFKLQAVYDLSATPYYLTGSGYTPYSLFPWVVSDFGLIEAIESGLVKIPFLPESDNTQELTMPVLRDLYKKVVEQDPNAFPKKRAKNTAKGCKPGRNCLQGSTTTVASFSERSTRPVLQSLCRVRQRNKRTSGSQSQSFFCPTGIYCRVQQHGCFKRSVQVRGRL